MVIETTLEQMKTSPNEYNWEEAFKYASAPTVIGGAANGPVLLENVTEIFASAEGENDGDNWMCVGRVSDGRYFFLSAGCDYTGWDCQAGGDAWVAMTLDELIFSGLGNSDRERLGIPQPA